MHRCILFVLLILCKITFGKFIKQSAVSDNPDMIHLEQFVEYLNSNSANLSNTVLDAYWKYITDTTLDNFEYYIMTEVDVKNRYHKLWQEVRSNKWLKNNSTFVDESLHRQIEKYRLQAHPGLSDNQIRNYSNAIWSVMQKYKKTKICISFPMINKKIDQCTELNRTQVFHLMETSKDYHVLKSVWLHWYNTFLSVEYRPLFDTYIALTNVNARSNNYNNGVEFLLRDYQSKSPHHLQLMVVSVWHQLMDFYQHLHAYVRYRLTLKYNQKKVPPGKWIPAHLLGYMSSSNWKVLTDDFIPFPTVKPFNMTRAFVEQNYTVMRLIQQVEDYFISLQMPKMPPSFWQRSIFQQTVEKRMDCTPMSWNFFNGTDFRLTQCTELNQTYYESTFKQLADIQYYMHYQNQPVIFRKPPNEGLHQGVTGAVILSVLSPTYLYEAGLMNIDENNTKRVINQQFKNAMEQFVRLPYILVANQWMWRVMEGTIPANKYNKYWWRLRKKYQGIVPPEKRTEEHLDIASVEQILNGRSAHIDDFVGYILQFQIYRFLCKFSDQYNPSNALHECSFSGNLEVGTILKQVLTVGASENWLDIVHFMTDQRALDGTPLLEYFTPLYDWLKKFNKNHAVPLGWQKYNV